MKTLLLLVSLVLSSAALATQSISDRRTFLVASASASMIAPVFVNAADFATSAGRRNCTTSSNPSRTVVTCTGDLMRNGRLQSIASTENGVSTSAIRNPGAYMAPWSYSTQTSDSQKAWKSLISAVQTLPNVEIMQVNSTYLHATVPSTLSVDDVEFVLRPDPDYLVLFRSASRTSVFVYPLTQPVSDQGINRKRMEQLRRLLGWQELN